MVCQRLTAFCVHPQTQWHAARLICARHKAEALDAGLKLVLTSCCPARRDGPVLHAAYKGLLGCVMTSRLPESDWYTAAEAAIAALYALHPTPQACSSNNSVHT